jgi:hypothetical protein
VDVGNGNWNRVPGPTSVVAFPLSNPAGVTWQLSQVVAEGMWMALGAPLVGITTILGLPAKLAGTMVGPWQLAQPVLMPVWVNWALAKLTPLAGVNTVGVLPTWQVSHAACVGMWAGTKLPRALGATP